MVTRNSSRRSRNVVGAQRTLVAGANFPEKSLLARQSKWFKVARTYYLSQNSTPESVGTLLNLPLNDFDLPSIRRPRRWPRGPERSFLGSRS
jgi:hypothetical protein